MSDAFPRTPRELDVWNAAIIQASRAIMRSAAASRARPLGEEQGVNRRRITIELIEAIGDEILRLGMTFGDLKGDRT